MNRARPVSGRGYRTKSCWARAQAKPALLQLMICFDLTEG
jgi:hypothetical protein